MEKQLLFLGLLRQQDMHAYQLYEFLEAHTNMYLPLKKSTVYSALKRMSDGGLVNIKTEQVGNRPPRQVYSITPKGEEQFIQLLRENLGTYTTPVLSNLIGIGFIDALPTEDLQVLLKSRREQAQQHLDLVQIDDKHAVPTLRYLQRLYKLEVEWLDEILTELSE
jgi:DNA-binding PadR family transcriptional regulator